jgi:hypothetical protein
LAARDLRFCSPMLREPGRRFDGWENHSPGSLVLLSGNCGGGLSTNENEASGLDGIL